MTQLPVAAMARRVVSAVEVLDSVGDGLIEERELAARQRMESLWDAVDRLVAELQEAEAAQERLMIAKETW